MDTYLDSSIGDNAKLLQDLLRGLQKERDSLEKQLSGAGSLKSGSEWLKVVSDVRRTVTDLETLHSSASSLEKANPVRGGAVKCDAGGSVRADEDVTVETLQPLVEELADLDRLHSYLLWIKRISQLCQQMESHLSPNLLSQAVTHYSQLSSLCVTLKTSSCSILRHYAQSSKLHWHTRLTEKLSSDFEEVLKVLQWPFTASAVSSKALEVWSKSKKKFTELFDLLISLDDRSSPTDKSTALLADPLLKPLELLVQPLRKRFKYHFFGSRKTNSKEKPEWYLTQVSTWIRDHSHFLEDKIQPLLVASGLSHVDARLEFIRGLLQEVESKVLADLSEVVYEDALMSHLIDELLIFERELRSVLQYPRPCPTPFNVLLGEVPFHKWLSLEKAYAIERVNTIVSSELAWQPAYDGIANADDTRVPQCTEGLMELIKGITDRYNSLSSTRHQLQFLELQRDLLLEFHHDLVTNSEHQLSVSPLHEQFIAYINAGHYIAMVMRDWGEQMFFLELYYHTKTSPNDEDVPHSDTRPPPLQTIQLMRRQDPEYAESEGSAFSVVAEAFSSLVEKLTGSLVGAVVESVKGKTYRYKKEKWHSMVPVGKDEVVKEVTQSAAELTTQLREHLVFINTHLSPLLSSRVFEKIMERVDNLIFTDVVLCCHFSEGGAAQLHYDLTTALHPLLSEYVDEVSRRQLLERSLEACKLLQFLPGSAKLLLELLGAVKRSRIHDDTYSAAVTALNDMGVHSIDPVQAEQVLRLRILQS